MAALSLSKPSEVEQNYGVAAVSRRNYTYNESEIELKFPGNINAVQIKKPKII